MTDRLLNNDREIKDWLWEEVALCNFYPPWNVILLSREWSENFYPILEAIWSEEQGL